MTTVDAVLLVLALTLAASVGARRVRTPLPVVLALAGLAAGALWHVVPWLPAVRMPGDLVLFVFLPPLLAEAAYRLPLAAFRRNLLPIGLLAVGLVLATMAGVGVAAHLLLPALPWSAAFVLGAIVAPPDPVAATAVARETGLPHRLVTILEGEGLVNDAIAIVAFKLAVDAATSGGVSWTHLLATVAREVPIGVAVGLLVGWAIVHLRRRLDDVTLEAGISLLGPYLTYHLAERLHGSAVLAVVAFGMLLRERSDVVASPAARLGTRLVWGAVAFASTSLVFLLVGLQLGDLMTTTLEPRYLVAGALVAAVVVVLRLAWMYAVPHLVRRLTPPRRRRDPVPPWRELTVLGWAGMRGVVSLALALALPPLRGSPPDGADARPTVILVAGTVILATLVLQGLTLLPLVRRLGAGDPGREGRDDLHARARARRAGLALLGRRLRTHALAPDVRDALRQRVESGDVGIAEAGVAPPELAALEAALCVQTEMVARLRAAGRISEALAGRLETELDLDRVRLRGDAGRLSG